MVKLVRISTIVKESTENTDLFSVDSHKETPIQGFNVSKLPDMRERIKRDLSPILDNLEKEYTLALDPLEIENQDDADEYLLFASTHDTDANDTNIPTFLTISRQILYSGNYVDKEDIGYLLSVEIDLNPNNSYSIWIRPELKGTSITKADNQHNFSFLEKWCEDKVLKREKRK